METKEFRDWLFNITKKRYEDFSELERQTYFKRYNDEVLFRQGNYQPQFKQATSYYDPNAAPTTGRGGKKLPTIRSQYQTNKFQDIFAGFSLGAQIGEGKDPMWQLGAIIGAGLAGLFSRNTAGALRQRQEEAMVDAYNEKELVKTQSSYKIGALQQESARNTTRNRIAEVTLALKEKSLGELIKADNKQTALETYKAAKTFYENNKTDSVALANLTEAKRQVLRSNNVEAAGWDAETINDSFDEENYINTKLTRLDLGDGFVWLMDERGSVRAALGPDGKPLTDFSSEAYKRFAMAQNSKLTNADVEQILKIADQNTKGYDKKKGPAAFATIVRALSADWSKKSDPTSGFADTKVTWIDDRGITRTATFGELVSNKAVSSAQSMNDAINQPIYETLTVVQMRAITSATTQEELDQIITSNNNDQKVVNAVNHRKRELGLPAAQPQSKITQPPPEVQSRPVGSSQEEPRENKTPATTVGSSAGTATTVDTSKVLNTAGFQFANSLDYADPQYFQTRYSVSDNPRRIKDLDKEIQTNLEDISKSRTELETMFPVGRRTPEYTALANKLDRAEEAVWKRTTEIYGPINPKLREAVTPLSWAGGYTSPTGNKLPSNVGFDFNKTVRGYRTSLSAANANIDFRQIEESNGFRPLLEAYQNSKRQIINSTVAEFNSNQAKFAENTNFRAFVAKQINSGYATLSSADKKRFLTGIDPKEFTEDRARSYGAWVADNSEFQITEGPYKGTVVVHAVDKDNKPLVAFDIITSGTKVEDKKEEKEK